MGTGKACGHPVGNDPRQGKWIHYYHHLGPYVLSLDCKDLPRFARGPGTCPCTTPEPDPSKPTTSHFSF